MGEDVGRGVQPPGPGVDHHRHLPKLLRDLNVLGARLLFEPLVSGAEHRAGEDGGAEAKGFGGAKQIIFEAYPVLLVQIFVLRHTVGVVERVRFAARGFVGAAPARVPAAHHMAAVEPVVAVELIADLVGIHAGAHRASNRLHDQACAASRHRY